MKLKEKLRQWLLRKLGAAQPEPEPEPEPEPKSIYNIVQVPFRTVCLRAEQKYSKEDLYLPLVELDRYVNTRLAEQLVDEIIKSNLWSIHETYNEEDKTVGRQATIYIQVKEHY